MPLQKIALSQTYSVFSHDLNPTLSTGRFLAINRSS